MTAPLTEDRPLLGAPAHAARLPGRSGSLLWARLQRGFSRQWPLALVLAIVVAAPGLTYDLSAGVSALSALSFWAPVAAAAALIVAIGREVARNTITSPAQLTSRRGFHLIGAGPELSTRVLRQLAPDQRTPVGCLAFQPASSFAAAFRELQEALHQRGAVAIIPVLPGDGGSTVALCTAISATQQGRKVVVVDCDVRRRGLTRALESEPREGVLQACMNPETWRDCLEEEPETGLHVLPAARELGPWRSLVGEPGFPGLIERLCADYDLVVLDCPPALAGEGPAIASLAEQCVLVASWDRTPLSAIGAAQRTLQRRRGPAAHVYLNRAPAD